MTGSTETKATYPNGVGAGTAWSGDAALIMPEPWMQDAACATSDPDQWFPVKGGEGAPLAKRVCASCDVRAECLEYALTHNERHGIWGGLSPFERRRLNREKAS